MSQKTNKMLKKYAVGAGLDYKGLKAWWKGLSPAEREKMTERIQEAMKEGKDKQAILRDQPFPSKTPPPEEE